MAYDPEVVVKEEIMEDWNDYGETVDHPAREGQFFRCAFKEQTSADIAEAVKSEPIDAHAELSKVSRLSATDFPESRKCEYKGGGIFVQPAMQKVLPEWHRRPERLNKADTPLHDCQAYQQIKEPREHGPLYGGPESTGPYFSVVTVKVEPQEYERDDGERLNVADMPPHERQAYQHVDNEEPGERAPTECSPEGDVPQFPFVNVKCEPHDYQSADHERLRDSSSTKLDVPEPSKSQQGVGKNVPVKFSCHHCGYRSTTKAFLRRHMTKHLEKKRFVCGVCDLSFNYVSHLKTHEMIHSGKRPYTCGICDHTSATSYNLKVHMRSHTGEKPFACDACDYRTKQKVHLIAHLKKHVDDQSQPLEHACKICDYRGPSKRALTNHMRFHKDQNPDKCGICSYSNLDKNQMKMHRKSHTIDNQYACDFCDYRSSSASHVKTHMLTHTGEKPHKCDFCDYRSKQRAHLKTHMMTHRGEKPFKCKFCDYRSNQSVHIKTHVQNYCPAKKRCGDLF